MCSSYKKMFEIENNKYLFYKPRAIGPITEHGT